MAFQGKIELPSGIIIPKAYIKITVLILDIIEKKCNIALRVYKNKDACSAKKKEASVLTFLCIDNDYNTYFSDAALKPSGITILGQAYKWLKTVLPYKEIEDV